MFVCKTCLERDYCYPKWDDVYSRSYGLCEICTTKPISMCIDLPARSFSLKNLVSEWECAAKNYPHIGGECTCNTITPQTEVIEIQMDVAGGVRCTVTIPDQKAAQPLYAKSFKCAGEVVKAFLRTKAKRVVLDTPKMATWGNQV